MRFTRPLAIVAAGLAALTALSACSGGSSGAGSTSASADDLKNVQLTVGDVGGWLQPHLEAAGLLDGLPYKVAFKDVGGGTAYSTLASHAIDAGVWGFDANGAKTIQNGSGARIIGLIGRDGDSAQAREQGNINFFVSRASKIDGIADLRGKTIGVNWGKGTTADVVLYSALHDAGISPGELTVQYFTDASGPAAFASGKLDGFITSVNGPLVDAINKNDAKIIYYANQASAISYVITTTQQVIDDSAKNKALKDFVGRVTKYYDWRSEAENHDAYAGAIAKQTKTSPELAGGVADYIAKTVFVLPFDDANIARYQKDLDNLVTWGLLDKKVAAKSLVNTSFNDAIVAAHQ